MSKNGKPKSAKKKNQIRFDYLKSQGFRTVHADGAIGGITPKLDISMNLWSERLPIPKQLTFAINDNGTLGDEQTEERVSRDSIVREVNVGVMLDLAAARAIRDWLTEKIELVEVMAKDRLQKMGGKANDESQ